MSEPIIDPDFPPEAPVPPETDPVEPGPEMPVVGGWLDAAAQAEAGARQYTDEQVPLVAGRMVPRNMDRPPTVEDGADLIAGTGWNQYDPATSDLVQMWRWDGTAWQALDMSAEMIPVLDIGSATVGDLTGGRINVQDGPIVAGDPAGARVELTGDGFHAYDASGTETATIRGEGGEFVGGEFRTSDTLPGQVTLSDTAYTSSSEGTSGPGIRIDPPDSSRVAFPPGIGPHGEGVRVDGGRSDTGRAAWVHADSLGVTTESRGMTTGDPRSYMTTQPDGVRLGIHVGTSGEPTYRHNYMAVNQNDVQLSGPRGLITASQVGAKVAYTGGVGDSSGFVEVTPGGTTLSYTASGVTKALLIDSSGTWVKTGTKSYNLEETAQDSGWQPITLASGITGAGSPAWRNKGGVIWLRGQLTLASGSWAAGWTTLCTLSAEARPATALRRPAAIPGTGGAVLQVGSNGVVQVYLPATLTGATEMHLSGLLYPLG